MGLDINNSIAMKWRGKISMLAVPQWHLMDIGFSGILLGAIQIFQAALVLLRVKNKLRDRICTLKTSLTF